jgi:ribosomal protein S18 acetylase RimI-like enzyme
VGSNPTPSALQPGFEASEVEIRRASADDAEAIGAVFDSAVRVGWAYLGEIVESPLFAADDWDRLVADHAPPNVLLVATDSGGRVLGYVAVHPQDGELFLLFVDPAYGGRGVGRKLLAAAHEALSAAGCERAFLYTEERNERALALYEHAGYRRDGTFRESDFRGVAIREPRLVKEL